MRRWVPVCTLLLLVPCVASAQSSRDEAIRKIVAGDYQGAAQLLRPLTEDPQKADPAALFLMAILYDFGQGVPRNVMAACGLYRQAAAAGGPFGETAATLDRMLREDSPVPEHLCATGPWHDVPDVSFTLGPDHTVQYSRNSIFIRYQGTEQKIVTGMLAGMIPLAPVYTPLDATQPIRERRHFLQGFYWSPDDPVRPSSWTLSWTVTEVVGTQFVHVTAERNVATAAGPKPPDLSSLGMLMRVHVGATGEPEWIIGNGPNARRGIVPRREPR